MRSRLSFLIWLLLIFLFRACCYRINTGNCIAHVGDLFCSTHSVNDHNIQVTRSLQFLQKYDKDFNAALLSARRNGKSARVMEFERAQNLTVAGLKAEREQLRQAVRFLSEHSAGIVLGILADSAEDAVVYIRSWVAALNIPRGVLTAYDESGAEISIESFANSPVYVKYNSTEGGNAYMKTALGDISGVIFQPDIPSEEFLQFAYLPLRLFS